MTYRIIIAPTARHDIHGSFRWLTEERSANVAVKWFNGLMKTINSLETSPGRWPLTAENDKFPVDVRELLHGRSKRGKYRILYTIDGDEVHVLYVRHSAQDEIEP